MIALTEHHGALRSPCPLAPVNTSDMVLRPEGVRNVQVVAKTVGLTRTGASLHRDSGVDATYHRTGMFKAGLSPNIQENPRQRKHTKRGRKRFFNAAIHALRTRVDRTLAWEDKCKRVLLRFDHLPQRHLGMKWLAYTLINLREFCGA